MPHGLTLSCNRYTRQFSVCYRCQNDVVIAASSGVTHLYTLRFKEKDKKSSGGGKGKQGSVQRFTFAGRLEFSVGQWVTLCMNFTTISPSEFQCLINLIGGKSQKRTQRSGKPFLFKRGWL
jgi:hypothetical protein